MDGSNSVTSRAATEEAPTGDSGATPGERDPRRRPRSTLTVALALVLATVAILAAVVADRAGAGPRAGAATTSPRHLPAVQTVGFNLSTTLAHGSTTTTLLAGTGAADLANGDGTTTLTVPALSGLLGSNDTVTARWQGTELYLQVPALSVFFSGKSWAEVSLSGIPGISSLGSTAESFLSDPSKLAAAVTSAGGTVTKVGTQANGTTEYQATIPVNGIVSDIQHLAHQHSTKTSKVKASSTKPVVEGLHHLGAATITADAWVASNGRLTQVSVTVDLSHATATHGTTVPGGLSGGVLTVTVGLTYGVPVSVTVPPASEVDHLGNVLPLLQTLGHLGSLTGLASRL
jgi:hypothetical protein